MTRAPTAGLEEFISAEQTITIAGGLTIAHGLGKVPKITIISLICKTAEVGYSIGDVVIWGHTASADVTARGCMMRPDATNLNIRFGSTNPPFTHLNNTTGAAVNLTVANWKMIFKAYA